LCLCLASRGVGTYSEYYKLIIIKLIYKGRVVITIYLITFIWDIGQKQGKKEHTFIINMQANKKKAYEIKKFCLLQRVLLKCHKKDNFHFTSSKFVMIYFNL